MNPVFKTVNRALDGAAAGLKAFSMRFQRGLGWTFLPRTNFDYGADPQQALQNSIIAGIIGWALRNYPEAPLRVQKRKRVGNKIELEPVLDDDTGPGRVLQLLEQPNEYYDGDTLIKAVLVDWITRANAYVVKVKSGAGRVEELWWLPEWLVTPRWPVDDPSVYISHYDYNPNGTIYRVEVEDMIHFRDGIDPWNTRKGMNKFSSLFREIFTDDKASNFSAALLNNLGVPGVIISPKDTGIAAKNRISNPDEIKDSFNQRFTGDGVGGAMVLTAPTDVTMLAYNPQQLTLKDLRRLPEERASSVIGIPAILAGLGAGLDRSTYSNMAEAREAGYEEWIIPTQRTLARTWKRQLLSEFADPNDYVIDNDLSSVRVLQEDQANIVERAVKALGGGAITRRMAKDWMGEEADDNDDVYYIPANVDVISADQPPPDVQEEPPPTPEPNPLTLPQANPQAATTGNGNGNGNGNVTVPA